MEKYKLSSYHKSGSLWGTSGGWLIITEQEYVIKYLFLTVATFEADKTLVAKLSSWLSGVGVSLDDGEKSIDLYLLPRTAKNLYQRLGIG